MKVQRMPPESYPLTLVLKNSLHIMYFWCSDGWCYIPEIEIRRKYIANESPSHFELIEEKWGGLIPVSEYSELVELSIYENYPRIWKEESEDFCELYVETKEIPNKNKKYRDHQPDQQQNQ